MKAKTKVHFICRGNVYRSRMAAHYLELQQIDSIEVSSSGIEAAKNRPRNKAIMSARPVELARWIGLDSWDEDLHPTQTTQAIIDSVDLIIFMNEDVAHDARLTFRLTLAKCETWDVADLDERLERIHKTLLDTAASEHVIEATHRYLQTRVDVLIHDICVSNMVDAVDARDRKLGYALPTAWTNRKALWHRGCHVILLTANHKVITEKRARKIMFSPSRLDFSAGGSVDQGETYEQAACRETYEELGIKIMAAQLKLIDQRSVDAYNAQYKLASRVHLRSYLVILPERNPAIVIEQSEVSKVYLLPLARIRRLVKLRRLVHIGRLASGQQYYEEILRAVNHELKASR